MQPRFNLLTHSPFLPGPYNYERLIAQLEEHHDLVRVMAPSVRDGSFAMSGTWRQVVHRETHVWGAPYKDAVQWACFFHPASDEVIAHHLRHENPNDRGVRRALRLFFIGEGEYLGYCQDYEKLTDRFQRALPRE